MTADDQRFLETKFGEVNRRIDDHRAEMAEHRASARDAIKDTHTMVSEIREAIDKCNSRVDTLTHWMMTSLVTGLGALAAAIFAWINPPKH
jgi:DNA-binding ferritin-like protein